MSSRPFTFFGRSSSLLLLIFYKLLLAAVEMLAGSLCLLAAFFAKHISVAQTIINAANNDRLDRFVAWLVQKLVDYQFSHDLILHIGMVLIALGIFKIFVAIGLWFKSHKMRLLAMAIFGALSAYSIYGLIFVDFSFFQLVAVLFDLFIVYYFWKILPKHLED
jgi:hypothetical protein